MLVWQVIATKRKVEGPIMAWELVQTVNMEWTRDKSNVYCLISWQPKWSNMGIPSVRLDLMGDDGDGCDYPIMSFIGKAENVRKYTMRFLAEHYPKVSLEHAAYIGREITRASIMKHEYVQD